MNAESRSRLLPVAVACAAPVLYALWIRPRMLTWGATRDETIGAYPGDELVSDPDGGATMATTLPAPPERVWPWLVQMGGDRAGWYSWDWPDNKGEPSADRIVPEWQSVEEGLRLKWITVELGSVRADLSADTTRAAVARYLRQVRRDDPDLPWQVIATARARIVPKVVFSDDRGITGWNCYLTTPLARPGTL